MAVLEIRKRIDLRKGMTLIFDPGIEALAGEDSTFFRKYAGMKAKILGFADNGPDVFDMMARAAGRKQNKKKKIERIFVQFENGDKPKFSIYYVHFLMP